MKRLAKRKEFPDHVDTIIKVAKAQPFPYVIWVADNEGSAYTACHVGGKRSDIVRGYVKSLRELADEVEEQLEWQLQHQRKRIPFKDGRPE